MGGRGRSGGAAAMAAAVVRARPVGPGRSAVCWRWLRFGPGCRSIPGQARRTLGRAVSGCLFRHRSARPELCPAWPVVTAEIVQVTSERRHRHRPGDGLMLTRDQNIVDIEFQVVWNVSDPESLPVQPGRPGRYHPCGLGLGHARHHCAVGTDAGSEHRAERTSQPTCVRMCRRRSTAIRPGSA